MRTPSAQANHRPPPPTPHNITYFCGVARGDFIDAQNPGTGQLAGAVNKNYNLGTGLDGHEKIKESPLVFADFLPLLNQVPPAPAVKLTVEQDSGAYPTPMTVTPAVELTTLLVAVTATRLTKQFVNGFIVDKILENRQETLTLGQTVTLATDGMWQLRFSAAGAADDLTRTYWVGLPAVTATITEPDEPFTESLLVGARTSDPTARLFHSLDGVVWTEGTTVTITQDAAVSFIAINPSGIASTIATRSFSKTNPPDHIATADAIHHFLAGRIDATEYVSYSQQFGFFTPFTLYRIDGDCVLDPMRPTRRRPQSAPADAPGLTAAPSRRSLIQVRAGDPQPGPHPGPITVVIEASDTDKPVTVYYTRDGSLPTRGSASFTGHAQFDMTEDGNRHSGHFRDHARLPITAGHRLRPTSGTPQGTRPAAHPCAGLAARVRRERADAIAAYQAEIALRARHARITAARSGSHLGPVLYG